MFGALAILGWAWYYRGTRTWGKWRIGLTAILTHIAIMMLLGLVYGALGAPPSEIVCGLSVAIYGGPLILGLAYRTRRPGQENAAD